MLHIVGGDHAGLYASINHNHDAFYYPLNSNPAAYLVQSVTDNLYSAIGHTHTFASITAKPTTIGGYGITDFNYLGDERWMFDNA